jgi:hypothetical protein
VPIHLLFEEDKQALIYLPKASFAACRYTRVKTDGYGKFLVDGKPFYSSSPEYARREVTVRIGVHTVEPLAPGGEPINTHIRQFGKQRTDSVDVRTTLGKLLYSPGAWRNSLIRKALPERLRGEMDGLQRSELKEALQMMHELTDRYDFDTAVTAMEQATSLGRLTQARGVPAPGALRRDGEPGAKSPEPSDEPGWIPRLQDTEGLRTKRAKAAVLLAMERPDRRTLH